MTDAYENDLVVGSKPEWALSPSGEKETALFVAKKGQFNDEGVRDGEIHTDAELDSDSDQANFFVVPAPVPDEMVERVLTAGAEYEPDEVIALRREWPGAEMNRNLGYVKAFLDAYVPKELQADIPDNVAMLRLGAHVARQVLQEARIREGSGKGRERFRTNRLERDTVLDQAATYRRLRNEAQARGDARNAKRYDALERKELARLGNAPVVGNDQRIV